MDNSRRITYLFEHLEQGMFSNANPSLVPDGFMANARNADLRTFYGMVVKQSGRSNTATGLTSGRNRKLVFFQPSGGTNTLITFQAGNLYTWPNSGTWTSLSGATGLTDEPMDLITATNKVFMTKQTEVVRYYDGATVTSFGDTNTDPARCKYGTFMLGWLLLQNDTVNPDGVYFGTNNNPLTGWNRTSNLLRFDAGDGGVGRGLKQWSNQDLIVFKENRIYAVTLNSATPGNWPITPITSDIGCVSGHSVQQVGEEMYFLSQDGIRSMLQSIQDKKRGAALSLSYPIRDFTDQINWQFAADVAASTYWKSQYWLSVPIIPNTVNSHTIIFNPRFKSFVILNFGFASFAQARFASVPTLYSSYGATTGGVNQEENTFNDGANPITWTVETKRINGPVGKPMPEIWKRGGELEVFFESTGGFVVTVDAAVDGGSYTNLGSMTLTGSLPTLPIALPFSLADQNISKKKFNLAVMGRFRDIQFRFQTSDSGAQVRLIRAIASLIPMAYTRDN